MHTGARRPGLGLLAVLLSAVGIAPLLNYGLSATSDLIIRELGISEAQFGLLATVCFGFAAVGNAVFSKFSDRQPDRTLMLLIFGAAAVSMGLAALPGGYLLLLAAAALSGLAQSFPNGVTNRVLAQRVPSARRIAWTGVKQSGVQVSQLVGSVGFPLLAAWIGWHGASLVGAVAAGVLG
ncbi:MFS transporter, partial [Glutamicibacter creatinolyticus]